MRQPALLRSFLPVFLIAPVLLLAACKSDQEKVVDFMAQGEEYVEEGKDKEAVIEYRNVLKIEPNNAVAHFALAKAYLRLGSLKDGYWELRESVRLDPENLGARERFAEVSALARDFEEVEAQADVLLEARPDSPTSLALKAIALEGLGRPDEAEPYLLQAVELDPDDYDMLMNLARHYARRGLNDKAETILVQSTQDNPSIRSFMQLARFYASQNRLDEAVQAGVEAVGQNKNNHPEPYLRLSSLYMEQDRKEEAIAILEDSLDGAEVKTQMLFELARIYGIKGDSERADALILQATESDPTDPAGYLLLSRYRAGLGDTEGALEAVEGAIAIQADNRDVMLRKAELLSDLGFQTKDYTKLSEARKIVEALLETQATDAGALIGRARIELGEGTPESAVVSLRQAINSRPDSAIAHFLLGSALAMQNDSGGARIELARSLELNPRNLEARRLLARVHADLGEHEYAIEQGRAYLKLKPGSVATRIQVAQSLVNLGKPKEAYDEIQRVPEDLRDSDVLYAIGRLQMAQGEWDTAIETMKLVNEKRPNEPDVLRSLMRMNKITGRIEESVAALEEAIEQDPTNAELLQIHGEAALLEGDREKAEASLKRATELAPQSVDALRRLAGFYQLGGDREGTLRSLEAALAIRQRLPEVHHTVGVIYETSGDLDRAREHYEMAILQSPDMAQSKNNLAYIFAEQGESLDRALKLAQEAKELLPDSPNVADTMGWVLYKRGGRGVEAAVGYLREAEQGMNPDSDGLGFVRLHLALAYEGTGSPYKAIESLDRALEALEKRRARALSAGEPTPNPPWEKDVRAARERLRASTG